ncbi:MAG: NACHT domain-containing NTPase [Microcystaceae cyanobacterium]
MTRYLTASPQGIQQLKANIAQKALNQKEIASHLSIHRSVISRLLKGESIQQDKFISICKFLGFEHWYPLCTLVDDGSEDVQQIINKIRHAIQNEEHRLVRVLDMRKPLLLEDIYVEVNVWDDFSQNYIMREQDQENSSEQLSSITKIKGLDAIVKYKRLLVLGELGAGKTTFLRYIAELCRSDGIEKEKKANIIPLMVVLRDYASRRKKCEGLSLFNYLANDLARYSISSQEFETLFVEGKIILLLDGLDEVTEQISVDISEEIIDLTKTYPKNKIVVSCRNAAAPFKLESFTEVQISEFDQKQVKEFIEKWFNSYQQLYEGSKERFKVAKEKLIRQLEAQSASTDRTITDYLRPIKEFTQTPLLLTLLCLVVTRTGEIPSGRLQLYKKSVDVFLSEWDIERGIKRTELKDFNKEQILTLLSDIALKKHQETETIISYLEIENILHQKNQSIEPFALISFLKSHYGLLIDAGFERYAFYHKTFQEYFVALGIVQMENTLKNINYDHIVNPFWREVLTLVIEFLVVYRREDLLQTLFTKINNCIAKIIENNPILDEFIQYVYDKVNEAEIQDEKEKSSLRVYLLDPDYQYDSSRTLLMELDQKIGNKLVASSFISRLFYEENSKEEKALKHFLNAFEVVRNISEIDNADNADHLLQIIYEYAKSKDYCLENKNYTFKVKDEKIKERLDEIYSNNNLSLGEKAKKCREVCLEYLALKKDPKLDNSKLWEAGKNHSLYGQLYHATLLLAKFLTIIDQSSLSRTKHLYENARNYVIVPSNKSEHRLDFADDLYVLAESPIV